jgi:LrgA family
MRLFLLSSELRGAGQSIHRVKRASDWMLKIAEFARRSNVLAQLGLLMTFQLTGEALVTVTGIPFPGPLCGMLLLLFYLHARGGPSLHWVRRALRNR